MNIFENLKKGLLEAIEIDKNQVPLVQRPNTPAPTFYAKDHEKILIDKCISIKKIGRASCRERV